MAITQQITCDVCGAHKRDVNHWWMYDPPPNKAAIGFVVWPWDEKHAIGYKHACGQECITKAINDWMQKAIPA